MDECKQAAAHDNAQWRKVKALEATLRALLPEQMTPARLGQPGKPGKILMEVQKTGGVPSALALSFPILQRDHGKDVEVAWINVQASLAGNGVPRTPDGQAVGAVVHVAHWACEFSFQYDAYIGFPSDAWQPWDDNQNGLLRWRESESPFGDEWLYSVPLAALADADAVRDTLIEPVIALLASKGKCGLPPLPTVLAYQSCAQSDGSHDLRVAP